MWNYYPKCEECHRGIPIEVEVYSGRKYGASLCRTCQKKLDEILKRSTPYAVGLYYQLKNKGIPVELEKFDGYKHIDIAIPQAKINIEVDGKHHNTDPEQAMTDLKRTYYSFKKGYYTIRIPNSISYNLKHLEETAHYLSEIIIDALKEREK